MSRLNRYQLNPSGLSKQSSRTYKAVRQKSNTDLDKTLKQLKLEHKASISKILQEEYTLKNVHYSLKTQDLIKGEEMSDCDAGIEKELQEGKMESSNDDDHMLEEKTVFVSKMASFKPKHGSKSQKKRHSFHLPSILEENSRCFVTQAPKTQFDNLLPPLFDFNPSTSRALPEDFPNTSRALPEGAESERLRSKSISVPDETRDAGSHRYVMRKRPSNGKLTGNSNKRKDPNGLDYDSTPQGWGEEMTIGRRYLRRSHSSPNVFDI